MDDTLTRIYTGRLIAIVRTDSLKSGLEVARDLLDNGVQVLELTLTIPEAAAGIRILRSEYPDRLIGAGTVITPIEVTDCLEAGAQFMLSPSLVRETLEVCLDANVPFFPGVFTPTEIREALNLGAPAVKLFPAGIYGPAGLRGLMEALPDARILPTGGVSPENALGWIQAGAQGVGIGKALRSLDPQKLQRLIEALKK